MSIKKLVSEKIESLRSMIAVWDNPAASQEEKGKVLASLLGNEPKFWNEVAKRASSPERKATTMKAEEVAQAKPELVAATKKVVAVQKAPTKTVAQPTPAKPVPATGPARTLKVQPAVAGTSVFAAKLNGAAKEVGLEDHTPLAKFRMLLRKQGQNGKYWVELRELLGVVLQEKAIQEVSDWKLLLAKMKEELFFGGKKSEAFFAQCPKEGVADLILSDDGLWNLVAQIRTGEGLNNGSPFHVSFVIDACVVVGKEAKGLLTECKQAVNHMKQMGFIDSNHWLVQKVAAMKTVAPRSNPTEAPESSSEAAADHKLDKIQEVVEAAEDAQPEKPESLGPEADAQFAGQMLAAAGEVPIDLLSGGIPDEELEKLTAPGSTIQ